MTHSACELKWIKNLLRELHVKFNEPLTIFCDNQAAMHIAINPLYHYRTKRIEVDCHFIREVVMRCEVCTPYIKSTEKLGDLFTKALPNSTFFYLCC